VNNIKELINIIECLGGSASIDEIANKYQEIHPMIIFNSHKKTMEQTLKDNPDLVRQNKGNFKWEIKTQLISNNYLLVSDRMCFKTIREAMKYIFEKSVPSQGAYFSVNDEYDAWFPQNGNKEWSNELVDDGKTWIEHPSDPNNYDVPNGKLRYTFIKEKEGYYFTGVFSFKEMQGNTRVYSIVDDKVKLPYPSKPMIVCRTTYMKFYDGITEDDKPVNGGSYVSTNNDAFEKNNFHCHEDGFCYGFVETKYVGGNTANNQFAKSIHIENIDSRYANKDSISGVRVVFAARSPIKNKMVVVGWYDNATIYRDRVIDGNLMYVMKCSCNDAHLIEEENRNFDVPAATHDPIGIGQSNFWYIQSNVRAKDYEQKLTNYIDSFLSENKRFFFEPVNLNQWNMFEKVSGVGHEEYFLATKSMKKGDYLIPYVGAQKDGVPSGVYALAEIITDPVILNNHEGDYCNEKLSVLTRFIIFSNEPIISSDVFSSIPGQFRTAHMINPEHYKKLKELFFIEK